MNVTKHQGRVNFENHNIMLDRDLADLFDIGCMLKIITFVKRLHYSSAYFIHCNLIDKEKNLFNNQPSSVLTRFDIKGKPFEKVNYQST